MQIPNISLAYHVSETKPVIEGAILRKVQELENGWLKLKLQTRQGTKDLIAAKDAVFFTSYSMPAKQTTSGYGAFLKKKLANKKIQSFKQKGFDRILVVEFESHFLVFELFAKGNIVLTDKNMQIVSAYRKEQWKDRAIKKGSEYRFPSSKGISPAETDFKKLSKILEKSSSDLVRTIVKEINIAPAFAEEACSLAGLKKTKAAKESKPGEIKALAAAIKELYGVTPEKSSPLIVEKEGQKLLLPFPLKTAQGQETGFKTLNQAIDQAYSKQFSQKKNAPEQEAFKKRQAELQKAMEKQKQALESLNQKKEQNSEKAKAVYRNYTALFELFQSIKEEQSQKTPEKEIMYKMKKRFPFLKSLDLKNRKIVVSLQK